MSRRSTVVAGDANNSVVWDKPGKASNFANLAAALGSKGLVSAYHRHRGVELGAEGEPTLYWRDRRQDGLRYHIDYCFIPEPWLPAVTEVRVGDFERWVGRGLSDHVPVIVELDTAHLR
jgi:exodeoxyribonuclease-3